MTADIRIVHNNGHYEVYIDGDFYCSEDTYGDAAVEVEKWLKMMNEKQKKGLLKA